MGRHGEDRVVVCRENKCLIPVQVKGDPLVSYGNNPDLRVWIRAERLRRAPDRCIEALGKRPGTPRMLTSGEGDHELARPARNVAGEVGPKTITVSCAVDGKRRVDQDNRVGGLDVGPEGNGVAVSHAPLPKTLGDPRDLEAHPTTRALPSPGPTG